MSAVYPDLALRSGYLKARDPVSYNWGHYPKRDYSHLNKDILLA